MAQSVMARPDGGPRTCTVIDEGYRTVGPVEEWLEAHRLLWSPNTVRGYATALSQWWTFLEQRVEADRWNEVGVPTVSAFVSWMRNGRRVERSLVPVDGPSPETMQARLAAVVSSTRGTKRSPAYRWPTGCCVGRRGGQWPGGCLRIWMPARRPLRRRWSGCAAGVGIARRC